MQILGNSLAVFVPALVFPLTNGASNVGVQDLNTIKDFKDAVRQTAECYSKTETFCKELESVQTFIKTLPEEQRRAEAGKQHVVETVSKARDALEKYKIQRKNLRAQCVHFQKIEENVIAKLSDTDYADLEKVYTTYVDIKDISDQSKQAFRKKLDRIRRSRQNSKSQEIPNAATKFKDSAGGDAKVLQVLISALPEHIATTITIGKLLQLDDYTTKNPEYTNLWKVVEVHIKSITDIVIAAKLREKLTKVNSWYVHRISRHFMGSKRQASLLSRCKFNTLENNANKLCEAITKRISKEGTFPESFPSEIKTQLMEALEWQRGVKEAYSGRRY